jgi:hypothetical protein
VPTPVPQAELACAATVSFAGQLHGCQDGCEGIGGGSGAPAPVVGPTVARSSAIVQSRFLVAAVDVPPLPSRANGADQPRAESGRLAR